MSRAIKQPYTFVPFDFIRKNKPEWVEDIKEKVTFSINAISELMTKEAEADMEESLLNPDYMYTCFKQNIEDDGFQGNWIILKYFSRMLTIKILKEMIGEWTYTKEDVEMYNYFLTLDVSNNRKASANKFRFNTGIEDTGYKQFHICDSCKIIYGKYESSDTSATNVFTINYYTFFLSKFINVESLVRRAKMLSPLSTINTDFMTADYYEREFKLVTNSPFNGSVEFSCEKLDNNWEIEARKSEYNREEFYNAVNKYVEANPIYNRLTVERDMLYGKLLNEFLTTEHGKDFMKYMPEIDKKQIKKMVK